MKMITIFSKVRWWKVTMWTLGL